MLIGLRTQLNELKTFNCAFYTCSQLRLWAWVVIGSLAPFSYYSSLQSKLININIMKNYKITEEFANKLLTYLSTRPYAEVINLISAFNDQNQFSLIEETVEETAEKQVSKKK